MTMPNWGNALYDERGDYIANYSSAIARSFIKLKLH